MFEQTPEIAEGHKEIENLMKASWRTIQRHKKRNKGFNKLFMRNPVSGKPFVITSEYRNFLIKFNKLKAVS